MAHDPRHGVPASWGGRVVSSRPQSVDLDIPFFEDVVEPVIIPGMSNPALRYGAMTIASVANAAELKTVIAFLVETAFEPWSKAQLLVSDQVPYGLVADCHEYLAGHGIIWSRANRRDFVDWTKAEMDNWVRKRKKSFENLQAFMNKAT